MLRFHLPPNLAAAAARNAVALRVECDLSAAPAPELLPALALLQRWSGLPQPPRFIQLTRAQLRELVAALDPLPLFVENGRPTAWRHDQIFVEAPPVPGAAPVSSVAAPKPKPALPSAALVQVDGSEHFLALTLPSPEHPRYPELLALVKEHGFILEPSNRKWWLRDRHKTLTFLAAHLATLRDSFGAQFTANFQKNTAQIRTAEITATVAETGGDFSVSLGLRATGANDSALRSALATSRNYVESADGIVLLEPARLAKLTAAQRALAGEPAAGPSPQRTLRLPAARAAEATVILEALSPNFAPPVAWRERSSALRNLSTLPPAPLPAELEAQLRPYQRLGAAWLWHLHRHSLGGILADEMGLGKTLQALALLSALRFNPRPTAAGRAEARPDSPRPATGEADTTRPPVACAKGEVQGVRCKAETTHSTSSSNLAPLPQNQPRASLVVCPASLLENWRREAARFAPQLRVFVHHADARLTTAAEIAAQDLIITSYGTLTRDQPLFAAVDFIALIADEAQHIKNRRSQNAAALRSLRARSRFLLTGTPLENSLDDLRSLFEVLLPGYLQSLPAGPRGEERAWYDDRLRAQTGPYILRRTKRAVAPELPAKLEQVLWCEMTAPQAALYRETQERGERELLDLEAGGAGENKLRFAALTQLLRLRQICCDPRLLPTVAGGADPGSNLDPSRLNPGSPRPATSCEGASLPAAGGALLRQSYGVQAGSGPADSAKLDAFSELLAEAVDDGHRVLVFSQFTSLLALLRPELEAQGLAHCYLDGSMPSLARQTEVDRFQSSPDIPVFLLSLKAGGTGLNLTGADVVVHFDPWWNPAVEAQATDRAHRIGQTRVVTSYKLITTGTVEEKVLALQAEKRALLAGVFEASDALAAKLSLTDLKSLLRPTDLQPSPPR